MALKIWPHHLLTNHCPETLCSDPGQDTKCHLRILSAFKLGELVTLAWVSLSQLKFMNDKEEQKCKMTYLSWAIPYHFTSGQATFSVLTAYDSRVWRNFCKVGYGELLWLLTNFNSFLFLFPSTICHMFYCFSRSSMLGFTWTIFLSSASWTFTPSTMYVYLFLKGKHLCISNTVSNHCE